MHGAANLFDLLLTVFNISLAKVDQSAVRALHIRNFATLGSLPKSGLMRLKRKYVAVSDSEIDKQVSKPAGNY